MASTHTGGETETTPLTHSILRVVSGLLLIVVLLVTFLQVVARYVFNAPFFWTEEVARYSYVWLCFIASILVMAERSHLTVDALVARLRPRARQALEVIALLICAVSSFAITVGSLPFLLAQKGASPAAGIPSKMFYGTVSLSIAMMGIFAGLHAIKAVRSMDYALSVTDPGEEGVL